MGDTDATSLVGRDAELAELNDGIVNAFGGSGQLFLLFGEPGIGKTRLAEEVSNLASHAGATVVWGRCWEEGGAPAYWPWIAAQRQLIASLRGVDMDAELRGYLDALPDLAVGVPAGGSADPDAARFALFDSFAAFLRAAADARPLVIVLDDLHAADEPSLLLLHFVARQLHGARLILVGTYRELEARRLPRVYSLLGNISREGKTLGLRRLDAREVGKLIATHEASPADSLVHAVHRATDGNPLFVNEVISILDREGRLGGEWDETSELRIPEGVRQAIRRRLETVSDDARRTLTLASVVGKQFAPEPISRVSQVPLERVIAALDEAIAAGFAVPFEGAYAFSHALVRETLYDDLGAGPRTVVHREVGHALEELYGSDVEAHAAEVAHHFLAAAGSGTGEQSTRFSAIAGDAAMQSLAYEDAVGHYESAVAHAPIARRTDLLLRLATASLRAGRTDQALARAEEVIEARGATPDERAHAVLLWVAAHTLAGSDPSARLVVIQRAVADPDRPGPALRARLLASMAEQLTDAMRLGLPEPEPYERASAAIVEADKLARSAVAAGAGDAALLAEVLEARLLLLPEHDVSGQRVALAAKLHQLVDEIGDPSQQIRAASFRVALCLEVGNVAAADVIIDESERQARTSRQPVLLASVLEKRAMRALLAGRFEDCERFCEEAIRRGGDRWRTRVFGLQLLIWREQDRFAELEEELRRQTAANRQLVLRAHLGLLLAETGRPEEAARLLPQVLADPLLELHRERPHPWTATVATVAEMAVELSDRKAADRLYQLFAPFAGRVVIYGALFCLGPVAYYLGRLATVTGDVDRAVDHLAAAIDEASRMEAPVWRAHAQVAMADALALRRRAGDVRHAESLRDEVRASAAQIGITRLARLLERSAVRTSVTGVFRREGQVWRASYAGTSVALPDSKGMRYLSWLLAAPRREVPAVELAAADAPPLARRALEQQRAAAPVLDPRAKTAYKRRLDELRETLAGAERTGDAPKALAAQNEIEALARELGSAVGLGGRDRTAGSPPERARQAVTKALRAAIDRVAEQHPSLGHHLKATIRTGALCSYSPDPRADVSWDVA